MEEDLEKIVTLKIGAAKPIRVPKRQALHIMRSWEDLLEKASAMGLPPEVLEDGHCEMLEEDN